jgi:mersacidin/lichenicidin family type 2 lantibiotic
MSPTDIIRAWKDPHYRATLSRQEQVLLPDHPAGLIELEDAYLDGMSGGGMCVKTTYSTNRSLGYRCL